MIEEKELISDILADKTDYKEKTLSRKSSDETDYIGKLMRQKMAVNSVWPNLQTVYKSLFPEG